MIANAFAKSIHKKAIFIHSSWPTLSNDLKSKCDIAIGGITKTALRAKDFYFSDGILKDMKAPIFSKKNAPYFDSFSSIDQPEVTIIENQGGTNETFALSHIKKLS